MFSLKVISFYKCFKARGTALHRDPIRNKSVEAYRIVAVLLQLRLHRQCITGNLCVQ